MKKIFFSLLFTIAVGMSYAQVDALKVDFEEGLRIAKEKGKIVLVNCTSETGCPPCIHVEKNYLPSKKMGDFINKHFVFLNYPTNHKENERLEEMFNVGSHPTFIFLTPEGKMLARSSGADFDEDKFIENIKYYLNPEHHVDNMKAKFESGKITSKEYYDYAKRSGLENEMAVALNRLFLDHKKAGTLKEFVTAYYQFSPMVYYNILDSELYEYTVANKEFILSCGIKEDTYNICLISPISNCVEKMLCNSDYSEKELKKVIEYSKKYETREAKIRNIQIEAVRASKSKGLEGVITVFDKSIDKLNEDEIFSLNLLIIRNYKYSAMTLPYMKKYIAKCIEKSPKRGARNYKFGI